MARNRFFVDKIADEVALTGDEFNHARHVLRLGEGDEATLLDGSGAEYSAIVARTERDALVLHVVGSAPSDREPAADVLLLIGALKGDKTELVVQKAVELGANRVGVFSSRYCAAYMNGNKAERLRRVAREAAKQCMRARVPEITYYDTLEKALNAGMGYENKLFACEFLGKSEGKIAENGNSYCLVVGSEGGFAAEEWARAKELGYMGVSLGKRILRAETAAIALLAVVMEKAGELK